MTGVKCAICMTELEEDERFVACNGGSGERHVFHADGCFHSHLQHNSDDKDVISHWAQHGRLLCPCFAEGCRRSVDDDTVFALGDLKTIKLFAAATRKIGSAADRRETAAKEERDAQQETVDAVLELLTACIACPHCKTPFIDFSNCIALTCEACKKEFCGVCLSDHGGQTNGHVMVASHFATFTPDIIRIYGFHGSYYITEAGWALWKENLKVDAVAAYLRTKSEDDLPAALAYVIDALRAHELLTPRGIEALRHRLDAPCGDHAAHLVRFTVIFWLLYSAKNDTTFERAVKKARLSPALKNEMARVVVTAVRAKHPTWRAVRARMPGEKFDAIDYPADVMPAMSAAVLEWGKERGFWK